MCGRAQLWGMCCPSGGRENREKEKREHLKTETKTWRHLKLIDTEGERRRERQRNIKERERKRDAKKKKDWKHCILTCWILFTLFSQPLNHFTDRSCLQVYCTVFTRSGSVNLWYVACYWYLHIAWLILVCRTTFSIQTIQTSHKWRLVCK